MAGTRFSLEGQAAVVTGAGRGIGKAIALALAESGADVAMLDRTVSELAATQAAVEALGRRALAVAADVSDVAAVRRAATEVLAFFDGRLDILVNNAGVVGRQSILEMTEEEWDRVIDTNLKGTFFVTQAFVPPMIAQRRGKIVNLGSTFGVVGHPDRASYAASKGAIIQLTRQMAAELAPHGINVNAVGPAIIRTELVAPLIQPSMPYGEAGLRKTPLGRFGETEDVAWPVVFLASPAADYITGHTLMVDGGWTAV
jgi:NAD(P)-dependent dehydrogenase (short-subunit alcohol dehydrogenase family)